MEHRQDVAARLKQLRGRMPQSRLAGRIDVSLRAYQTWEAGSSAPNWENLERLAAFYGVSENFLLYGSDSRPIQRDQLDRIEARISEIEGQLRQIRPARRKRWLNRTDRG